MKSTKAVQNDQHLYQDLDLWSVNTDYSVTLLLVPLFPPLFVLIGPVKLRKTKERLPKEFKVTVSADCRGLAVGKRLEVVKRRQILFHAVLVAAFTSCAYCSSCAVDSRRSGMPTPTLPRREGSRHMCDC